ncbi:MAG: hypothetical protein H0X41_04325 [Chitinophagaceae bacterium]|nr:hypothetical protein [Chitinophagaceae bacterium]
MKKFYISSTDQNDTAGNYSEDFYRLVLRNMEYEFINRDEEVSNILSLVASMDHVHLEIGPGRTKEWELLKIMLDANYKSVAITLHNVEFFKEAMSTGKNGRRRPLAKFYYHFIGQYQIAEQYLRKIKWIYVLTFIQQSRLRHSFRLDNVHYLPRIINPLCVSRQEENGRNIFCQTALLDKGSLDYLLILHKNLLNAHPQIRLLIAITEPVSTRTLTGILDKYNRNVQCILLPDKNALEGMLKECAISVIVETASGLSGINQLLWYYQRGKVVFFSKKDYSSALSGSTPAYYLSGNIQRDVSVFTSLLSDPVAITTERKKMSGYLTEYHSFHSISQRLNV